MASHTSCCTMRYGFGTVANDEIDCKLQSSFGESTPSPQLRAFSPDPTASASMMSTMAKPVALGQALPLAANRPFVKMAVAHRRGVVGVRAAQNANTFRVLEEAVKAVVAGTFATSFLAAGNACAASEVAQMAAGDGRLGILLTLFAPVVGWVLFNIGGPALNQLDTMGGKKARSVAAGLGLGAASLLAAQNADAATELAQTAAGDGRLGILLTLFAPVVGWVLFNIGGPALNQLDTMGGKKARSIAAGLGLGAASLLAAQNADAATELAQAAAGDGRLGILLTLFAPVVGWVLFNIGGPALNQLDTMGGKKARSIMAGLGLGAASLLAAQNADAATELAQTAAGDGRLSILLLLFAPVVGWVLFNIGGPALNQLDNMGGKSKPTKRRGVVAGLGLTAASLMAAQNADAATELAQTAAGDGRFSILLLLFAPVVGWVLFNIGGPALNQLDSMGDKSKPAKRK